MTDFNLKDLPLIELGNPAWRSIEAWAKNNLEKLRGQRENKKADLRKLDQLLGEIDGMKDLLALPALIKRERSHVPTSDDNFNIPPLS